MSQITPPFTQGTQGLAPHRGGLILALGILGIVLCGICGIIAWVLGNNDLKEMDAGRMDPSGRGTTQAGKICGIIGLAWQACGIVLWLVLVIGAIVLGAATHKGP